MQVLPVPLSRTSGEDKGDVIMIGNRLESLRDRGEKGISQFRDHHADRSSAAHPQRAG